MLCLSVDTRITRLEFLPAPDRLETPEDEVHVWRVDLEAVASQWALREILGRHLGLPGEELRFEAGEHGKPRLTDAGRELAFNLSHSGSLALVAIARREVGVDVERIRTKRPVDFYRRWADREARVKCLGTGLTGPVPADATEPAIHRLDVGAGYAASVAFLGPAKLRGWTFGPHRSDKS
jgi:phosphopantetheinyl transferase